MSKEQLAVVIDNGSHECKVGIAGDCEPKCPFPAVVGKPKHQGIIIGIENKLAYVGYDALRMRGVLELKYPMSNGIVQNWDDMERIWHYAYFNELRVLPENQPALLTEVPLSAKQNREKMSQIFFESLYVPSFYVASTAMLSLYASGRTTGIVVDSGNNVSYAAPFYEGYALPYNVLRINIAGRDCTEYLVFTLTELGFQFTKTAEMEIARDMKEKLCYVANDYDEEMKKEKESTIEKRSYELPDGHVVVLQNHRFRCPELLFKPSLFGLECSSIDELTYKSIMKSDIDLRKELYKNIILSGGNTMFSGFAERMSKELKSLSPQSKNIQVVASADRKLSTWIGGSILSSLSAFQTMWIKREEYNENGPTIVHRKCF
ncbi:unnamed protein product [Paramecium sonneborni]|uniref:Actin, cytoplasmic n=1 Tax=Paramecium sonneborni TaxID=65129 RepID=A0A8S1QVN5_9CILI|nr:unnamed protein product [Paramecium sonneborni]